MVMCKFFLQGYCKNGTRCRFEHTNSYDYISRPTEYGPHVSENRHDSYRYSNTNYYDDVPGFTENTNNVLYSSPLAGHFSGPSSQLSSEASINKNLLTRANQSEDVQSLAYSKNVQELVQAVIKDTLQLEKGNQWPLSCYCPLKEYGNLPGCDDLSPEEVRWGSYNSVKDGTFSLYNQNLDSLYKNAQEKRNDWKMKEKATELVTNLIRNQRQRRENRNAQCNDSALNFGSVTPSHNTPFQPTKSPLGTKYDDSNGIMATHSFMESASLNTEAPALNSYVPRSSDLQTSFVFSLRNQTIPDDTVNNETSFQNVQNNNVHGKEDDLIYSKIEMLTPQEINMFESHTFTFRSIPLKPPPKSLCHI